MMSQFSNKQFLSHKMRIHVQIYREKNYKCPFSNKSEMF